MNITMCEVAKRQALSCLACWAVNVPLLSSTWTTPKVCQQNNVSSSSKNPRFACWSSLPIRHLSHEALTSFVYLKTLCYKYHYLPTKNMQGYIHSAVESRAPLGDNCHPARATTSAQIPSREAANPGLAPEFTVNCWPKSSQTLCCRALHHV